jgi:hypothetical protein
MTDLPLARKNIDLAYGRTKALRDELAEAGSPSSLAADATYAMRRLIDAKNALAEPAPPPPPPPPPPPVKPLGGAMVVTAGNLDPQLLRDCGVTHVAVEMTEANDRELALGWGAGMVLGWFMVSRGNDGDTLATVLAQARSLKFAVIDTESHKVDMGGSLAWTETLYAALRSRLGPTFPLFNVTFGVHSSPAVVNHEAFRRHNVVPIWEAYDGPGNTLGVGRTAAKAISEGWASPHIALGDKSLLADAQELGLTSLALGGVWLWAPDNGQAQEDLRAGAAAKLRMVLGG